MAGTTTPRARKISEVQERRQEVRATKVSEVSEYREVAKAVVTYMSHGDALAVLQAGLEAFLALWNKCLADHDASVNPRSLGEFRELDSERKSVVAAAHLTAICSSIFPGALRIGHLSRIRFDLMLDPPPVDVACAMLSHLVTGPRDLPPIALISTSAGLLVLREDRSYRWAELGGKLFRIEHDGYKMLRALIGAQGDRVKGGSMELSSRHDHVLRELPAQLQEIIESKPGPGGGYWLL